MAGKATAAYQDILNAARTLPPAEQLRLAKELVSGDQLLAFWEDWQRQLAAQGEVVSDAEIDTIVTQVRVGRRQCSA